MRKGIVSCPVEAFRFCRWRDAFMSQERYDLLPEIISFQNESGEVFAIRDDIPLIVPVNLRGSHRSTCEQADSSNSAGATSST